MSIKKQVLVLSCAVVGSVLMTATALAAQATASLNIRSGPGTNYSVVDRLSPGVEVDIRECQGSWCYVVKPGPDGWASRQYLSENGDERPPRDGEQDRDVTIDLGGLTFSFGIGSGFDRRPIRREGQACFYADRNFGGPRFCAQPGDNYPTLNRFNNRISSLRVSGGVRVLVCEDSRYRGRCAIIDRSIRDFGRRNDNIISSLRVR